MSIKDPFGNKNNAANPMMNLLQTFGSKSKDEKSIGRQFHFLAMSLTCYLASFLVGKKYTCVSSLDEFANGNPDILTALKEIQNKVVKPTLNAYSIANEMPMAKTVKGIEYPLMNFGLANPIFKTVGRKYEKGDLVVDEKPSGKLPKDLAAALCAEMLSQNAAFKIDPKKI